MNEVQVVATGRYAPKKVLTNAELSKVIDTNDEWIKTRTGISQRRIALEENTSDLATKAAQRALEKSKIKAEELDLIIVATVTPDCYTPSTACIVQKNLKAKAATAFDINAACSGFIYAFNIASQFIKTKTVKKALIIGAETLSKICDWNDRSTCVLFGDGAGAAILSSSKEPGLLSIYAGSNGEGEHLLKCKAETLGVNNTDLIGMEKKEDGSLNFISMEGREVFKFAVKVMDEGVNKLLKDTSLKMEEVQYIIPHQANLRMIEYISKKLKVGMDKFYTNIQHYGNTSSASIPIALDEMNEKGLLKKGDNVLMVGFGGGLTWGGAAVKWSIEKNKEE
ncbi:beta-ketoacyl-ACP synthase III [Proteinivorax hydrogeniformans]|uniref:Beta-ketoacyl-[acyl-carrier-protein] synthase III n=1 Tax=Proteinivorax hydrogeniformans TaxID=1826727 RepID=A0AAU8HVL6_9FIRM